MIIAFSGQMGVGKSTAIETLRFLHRDLNVNSKIKVVKFAQPLYDMQEMIYRRIESVHQRPANFVKDRKLLQYLGTEWARETISKTVLIDLWKKEAQIAVESGFIVVCDDCRYNNEAAALKSLGGIVINITSDKFRAHSPDGIKNHASEIGIDFNYIDYSIDNSETLDSYDSKLRQVFKQILVPITAQKQGEKPKGVTNGI